MTIAVDVASVTAKDWGWRHAGRRAWAVSGVSFQIQPGEKVLLLGPSGSGKSTLLQGIAGLLGQEEGESQGHLTLAGQAASSPTVRGLVGMVQQDPDSQIVMDQVGDEVAFGCENLGIPRAETWARVAQALADVGLDLPLDHPTEELSGGQKQRLALACALAMSPRVLLLDEPTANLDPAGVDLVRGAVERVAARSEATLIIIEHRVDTWIDLVDRIIVLDDHGVLADGSPVDILETHASRLLDAGVWVPGLAAPVAGVEYAPGETCLATHDLAIGYGTPIRSGLNIRFQSGISTCIVGANGAGKTTLALTLAGLLAPVEGRLDPAFADWRSRDLPGKIAMVFQEPSYQFLCSTVEEELEFGLTLQGIDPEERRAKVTDYLQRLRLTELARAHPLTLSGGEKRRLSVASAIICAPEILVLDEPTFGQDRNTWVSLVQLLQELVAGGTTIISITHDQAFVKALGQDVVTVDAVDAVDRPEVSRPPRIKRPLDRVNPLTQILGLALMTLPLILTIDVWSAAIALGVELLALPFLGWGPLRLLRRVWPLLVAAPLAAVSMLLYGSPGGQVFWSFGPAIISENSVGLAIAIALRVLAVGIPAVVLLSGLNPTAVADSFTQIGRLPARPVLASLAGIRLVTLMLDDWQALQRARRSRGVGDQSRIVAFFRNSFALFAFALRRAGTLSITMEARGFGAPHRRSHARVSTVGGPDVAMLVASIVIPVIALGVAILTDSFRWFGL